MLALISGDGPKVESAKQGGDPAPPADGAAGTDKASGGDKDQKPTGEQADKQAAPDERKKKDDERFDRNWKKLQEEKEATRQERLKHEADLKELEELRATRIESESLTQAREYDRLAEEFEAEGNADAAKLARAKSAQARNEASAKLQEERGKRFMQEWKSNFEKAAEADKDLYDDSSALFQGVEALLKAEPVLRNMPDGINKAVAYIKNSLAAQESVQLKADLAERDKRIAELTQKLTLGGSNPAAFNGNKDFKDMDRASQRKALLAKMMAGE